MSLVCIQLVRLSHAVSYVGPLWPNWLAHPAKAPVCFCLIVPLLSSGEHEKISAGYLGYEARRCCFHELFWTRIFSADLKYKLQGVWGEAESVDPRGNNKEFDTNQVWFITPFACNARQTYIPLPWNLFSGFAYWCSCNQTQDDALITGWPFL
eukprot:1149967-Pelagomonas_calceolata.AAC.3